MIERNKSLHGQIFLTTDYDTKSTYYIEQILPLLALDNVSNIGENQLLFSDIFRLMKENLPADPRTFDIVRKMPLPPDSEIYPIRFKISSRPEYCIDKDFDFHFDPFEDRSWRFWYQNLSWLEEHLHSLGDIKQQEQQFETIF